MSVNVVPKSTGTTLLFAGQVLRCEAEGLMALARGLDDAFETAVGIFRHIAGRVAVTGMGKSGHVAAR